MERNNFDQKLFYVDYTWKELEALDRARVILVLPSGSIEEHGAHLTMATDTLQAEQFCLLAARQVKDVIVLPALWYTTAVDTSNYTGTISLTPSVFIEMVMGVLTSLYRSGFRRIVIGNVHGSAKTPLDVAIREFHARLGSPQRAYNDDCRIHLQNLYMPVGAYLNTLAEGRHWGHACEMETSVCLHLCPDKVDMALAVDERIPWEKGFEWYTGDMRAVNTSGVHGMPTHSSAQKGKKIVDAIVAAMTDILQRF